MIQRIQTLYLLVVTALMSLTLFMPIASFVVGGQTYELTAFALSCEDASHTTLWMGIMLSLATLLPFITIFLFVLKFNFKWFFERFLSFLLFLLDINTNFSL